LCEQSKKIIQMKNICKSFLGVKALDDVSFDLKKEEVHCLIGENGAGKSTLVKILSGAYKKDSGTIIIRDKEVEIENVHDAKNLSISAIHQEINLVQSMNVVENVFLGEEIYIKGTFQLDWRQMQNKTKQVLDTLNISLDMNVPIRALRTAQQQMVEIARSLIYKRDIMIMDESTASISNKDTQELFKIIRHLKKQGVSIIYISHSLKELPEIADRVTVLRDGKKVRTVDIKEVSIDNLINMMVGRSLENFKKRESVKSDYTVLEVTNISRGSKVKNASFNLKKGEILGFAGLVGSGRTELMRLIFGADKPEEGQIVVKDKVLKNNNPVNAVRKGIAYLSEDRKMEGLILGMPVSQNITLSNLSSVSKGFVLNLKEEKTFVGKMIKALKIATPSASKIVRFLSGGNQQKVVIAKWLASNCDVMIFDEPTKGIDVGARLEVYQLMNELVKQGKSIIMVSSDLPEIMLMSDRIAVMSRGKITGVLENNGNVTQEEIMNLMLGGLSNVS